MRFVVMDICLKGEMDGFEATRQILECNSDIPVVLVSAVTSNDWSVQAKAAGAIALFQKPVPASAIMARVVPPRNRKCSDPCAPCDLREPLKSLLQAAVCRLDLEETARLLENSGDRDAANEVDYETGNSLLHGAARLGSVKMLQLLLEHGANPNAVSKKGYTALHVAAWSGHVECVELLITRGCDPEISSVRGFRALDVATEDVQPFLKKVSEKSPVKSGTPSPTRPRLARRRSLSGQALPFLTNP